MPLRFLTADTIHDGRRFLPSGSVLEITDDGTIIAIHDSLNEPATEHFSGILTPGFVNAHCHLELSHMRGVIPEKTGLIPFLQAVTGRRADFSEEQKEKARHEAFQELFRNGVVAVGDIANTADTLDLRTLNVMHMHSFVESLGFTDTAADARLAYSKNILHRFQSQETDGCITRQSIVPHAPYSVSPALFHLIDQVDEGSLLSIHNQESAAEDEYYNDKTGPVRDLLEGFGIDDSFFTAPGKSSLQSYLPLLSGSHPLILVHNTFSTEADIAFAHRGNRQLFWCLCPGANMYIEGRLPDVSMLRGMTDNICIGTDSLASNHQLSVFAELQLLKARFPELEWEQLIRWGTFNGAKALQMADVAGSLTSGRKPGIVNITTFGQEGQLTRII